MTKTTTAELSLTRRAGFAALAVVLAAALGLVVCELVLRLRQGTAVRAQLALLRENPQGTGSYRLRRDLDVTTHIGSRTVTITTNTYGMPQGPVTRESPQGRTRIAFLGDSFTFGLWATDSTRSFVGVVAERLGTQRFEVLNFGVTGYGLDDMALLLREEAAAFAPRFIVVTFYAGNDFADTHLGLEKMALKGGTVRFDEENLKRKIPAEHRRHVGRVESGRQFLRQRFATYHVIAGLKRVLFFDVEDLFQDSLAPSAEFLSYTFWSQMPYPPVAREARDASLRSLDEIHGLAEGLDAQLLVVAVPYLDQVYVRAPSGPGYDAARPQRFVEEWAESRGVSYLDLLPPLREQAAEKREELYVRGEIHFNDAGHAVVGEWLYEWLATLIRGAGR